MGFLHILSSVCRLSVPSWPLCPGKFSSIWGQIFYKTLSFLNWFVGSLLSFLTLRRVFPWPRWCFLGLVLPLLSRCFTFLFFFCRIKSSFPVQTKSENLFCVSFCPSSFFALWTPPSCPWWENFSVCGAGGEDPSVSLVTHFCLMGSSS